MQRITAYKLSSSAMLLETHTRLSNQACRHSMRLAIDAILKGEYETDKISAYQTLYICLDTVAKLAAPISPFFTDAVYRNLNAVTGKESVASIHHTDFPVAKDAWIDLALEERMSMAREFCSLVRKKKELAFKLFCIRSIIPLHLSSK